MSRTGPNVGGITCLLSRQNTDMIQFSKLYQGSAVLGTSDRKASILLSAELGFDHFHSGIVPEYGREITVLMQLRISWMMSPTETGVAVI